MNSIQSLPVAVQTVLLLLASNVFMTFAWYGHLKNLAAAPWYAAALASWGIALFEYLLQVPANRIGFRQAGFTVGQLKIVQEVVTLGVFVPFAMLYLKEPFKLDYLWQRCAWWARCISSSVAPDECTPQAARTACRCATTDRSVGNALLTGSYTSPR